jgi:hypothetical protein
MRGIIIVFLLILMIVNPVYANNFFDALLYKKVFLTAIERTVLVNRITGEVKYILRKGQWILLDKEHGQECLSTYKAQLYYEKNFPK